ncbi:MAG TPA: serine protease [Kofleriaceae bacterium]|nr:serine protease [Kofleriaceae bacterium]
MSALALALAACGGGGEPPLRPLICGATQLGALAPHAQCGPALELTPINQYQGPLAWVQDREDAVVLIDGDCTGTLIAAQPRPVVLTAGHCVAVGDQALVAFNVEDSADGDPTVTGGTVFEQSTAPDYALLQLDRIPRVTPSQLSSRIGDDLAVIQHPRGGPKAIALGTLAGACNEQLYYTDLDTLVGSSGAGVLNDGGYVAGVHTDGDCGKDGSGFNRGWSAASIVAASAYLQDTDIADR